jgi:hypothetical protein
VINSKITLKPHIIYNNFNKHVKQNDTNCPTTYSKNLNSGYSYTEENNKVTAHHLQQLQKYIVTMGDSSLEQFLTTRKSSPFGLQPLSPSSNSMSLSSSTETTTIDSNNSAANDSDYIYEYDFDASINRWVDRRLK